MNGKTKWKIKCEGGWKVLILPLFCWCSVIQSCPALCNAMDCKTPGFPVLHRLLEFAQTRVHWVGDAIQQSCPLGVPFSSCLQSLLASGSFTVSQLFISNGQSIRVSASASVLSMNWFPLGLSGWVSLLSKGLSRVFSNTTVQKHQIFNSFAEAFF